MTTNTKPTRHYGFATDGTFTAVDHDQRIGVFSLPTSPNATRAKRHPEAVANEMIDSFWAQCPDDLREAHYKLSCADLGFEYEEPQP